MYFMVCRSIESRCRRSVKRVSQALCLDTARLSRGSFDRSQGLPLQGSSGIERPHPVYQACRCCLNRGAWDPCGSIGVARTIPRVEQVRLGRVGGSQAAFLPLRAARSIVAEGLLKPSGVNGGKMRRQEGRKIYESLGLAGRSVSCSDLAVCRGGP